MKDAEFEVSLNDFQSRLGAIEGIIPTQTNTYGSSTKWNARGSSVRPGEEGHDVGGD